MARILLLPLFEYGHVLPFLYIGRALREQGHHVIFGCGHDLEDVIRQEGFEFEPLFVQSFPKGFRQETRARLSQLRGVARLRYVLEQSLRWDGAYEFLLEGGFERLVDRLRPDLGLCDVTLSELALSLYGKGVPVLQINTSFPVEPRMDSPPPMSHLLGGGGLRWRARVAKEWGAFLCQLEVSRLLQLVGLEARALHCRYSLAKRYGYPLKDLDTAGRLVATERSPILVLCPREFAEFPGVERSSAYEFAGPCVDFTRQEPTFDWRRLREDAPLIVCSLGTMPYAGEVEERFFRAVLEVARQRPRWQFVLATGQRARPDVRERAPGNVLVETYVPQLQLLGKAAVMVTHSGLNSVKECICLGVPVVAVPMDFDQPGVAARVVSHGIGVRASPMSISGESLVNQLDELLDDPSYKHRVARMGAAFRGAQDARVLAGLIEKRLTRPVGVPLARTSGLVPAMRPSHPQENPHV
jgi:zeaxanthin glucosyltransferase